MTTKHFKAIAGILGRSDLTEEQMLKLAESFCVLFAQENRNFKRSTFLNAVVHEMGLARYEEKKRLGAVANALRPQFLEDNGNA